MSVQTPHLKLPDTSLDIGGSAIQVTGTKTEIMKPTDPEGPRGPGLYIVSNGTWNEVYRPSSYIFYTCSLYFGVDVHPLQNLISSHACSYREWHERARCRYSVITRNMPLYCIISCGFPPKMAILV